MDYFSQHIFSDPEKKTLDYSLWFEPITAGYFLGGREGGIFPPLTAVFHPFRFAVIIVYYIFQKIIHPQDPRTPIFPPFKISLENILSGIQ